MGGRVVHIFYISFYVGKYHKLTLTVGPPEVLADCFLLTINARMAKSPMIPVNDSFLETFQNDDFVSGTNQLYGLGAPMKHVEIIICHIMMKTIEKFHIILLFMVD